jgi:hypothetical protein
LREQGPEKEQDQQIFHLILLAFSCHNTFNLSKNLVTSQGLAKLNILHGNKQLRKSLAHLSSFFLSLSLSIASLSNVLER